MVSIDVVVESHQNSHSVLQSTDDVMVRTAYSPYVISCVIIPTVAAVGLLLNAAQLALQGRRRVIARHHVSLYLAALSAALAACFLMLLLHRIIFALGSIFGEKSLAVDIACRISNFIYRACKQAATFVLLAVLLDRCLYVAAQKRPGPRDFYSCSVERRR